MLSRIQKLVSRHYGVERTDLVSRNPDPALTLPRRVGMYLARLLTCHSIEEIGRHFGGRHHVSVIHGIRTIQRRAEEDAALSEDLKSLTAAVG